MNLKNKIENYFKITDYYLLPKVPIIISINGRSTEKVTSELNKPYDSKFADVILSTALTLSNMIDGTFFTYQSNDDILLITQNNQSSETDPWFNNSVQKIASATSSMATSYFSKYSLATNLNLNSDLLFTSHIFSVPNLNEVINVLVYKQQQTHHNAIQSACYYELLKIYDKNTTKSMLMGLSSEEKIELLKQDCKINYSDYPNYFKRGAICHKIPKIINDNIKYKFCVDTDIPVFTKEQSFLNNIFKS